MTRPEFKSILKSYIGKKEYDDATALLLDWDGCSEITINDVNDYGCTLGNVISTLDKLGVYHELKGLGSDSGMHIHIPICK
jgi:hypothetical protein